MTRAQTSATVTTTDERQEQAEQPVVMELKVAPEKQVSWTEDVVDNEFAGKKSSKKCCQYHKPRPFGESSSESSSDEESKPPHKCGNCKK